MWRARRLAAQAAEKEAADAERQVMACPEFAPRQQIVLSNIPNVSFQFLSGSHTAYCNAHRDVAGAASSCSVHPPSESLSKQISENMLLKRGRAKRCFRARINVAPRHHLNTWNDCTGGGSRACGA